MPRVQSSLKYMEVATRIRERITGGQYRPGDVIPGQREIAEQFGVSRDSVRRALDVLEASGTLRCVPSVGCIVEQVLTQTAVVGYLVSNLSDPFHAAIISELDRALTERNAALLVGEGEDPRRLLDAGATKIIKQHYIECEHPDDPPATVYVGDALPDRHAILSADRQGIRLLYNHLRGLGHTRIAYYGPGLPENTDRRYEALVKAKAEDGLPVEDRDAFFQGEADPLERMLETIQMDPAPPTALMCFDDERAIAVMREAQALGLRIPQDFSLTGYDDIPMSRMLAVPLTTVSFSAREIAHAALAILFAEDASRPQRRLIPAELKVRASTAAAS